MKQPSRDNNVNRANIDKKLVSLKGQELLDFQVFSRSETHGKVLVDEKDIDKVLLDIQRIKWGQSYTPIDNISKITLQDMKKRIGIQTIINPNFPIKDLNQLFQGKQEITSKELQEFLNTNTIQDYDPLEEAINMFLDEKDQLDVEKVNTLLKQLGYAQFDNKDIKILTELLDVNNDARIDRTDLMDILSFVSKQ